MRPQIVNAKMNKMILRGKIVKASVFAAIAFSVVMMTGYRSFARSVFITDNGVTKEVKTNEKDVYEILRTENYALGAEDRVSYAAEENGEGHITIHRAFEVKVKADGETYTLTTVSGDAAEMLELAGITLGESDEVNMPLDEAVTPDSEIVVKRVRYSTRTEKEEIPFETETVEKPLKALGSRKVVVEGEVGISSTTFKDTYVDGKLTKTEKLSQNITKQPVNEVIEQGTKSVTAYNQNNVPKDLKLVDGIPENYTRVLSGKATAYSARPGAGTASGRLAEVGTVAVDPSLIPYGSELYIISQDGPLYGYAIAADTGSGLINGAVLVDVFMASYEDCCDFGAHMVDVYVISEGKG